jgi:hypothetical protein
MKNLYLLVSNGGDGSYSVNYSMSDEYIARQRERYNNGELDYEYDAGVDGDGFHYDTLKIPDDMTKEQLGIYRLLEDEEN